MPSKPLPPRGRAWIAELHSALSLGIAELYSALPLVLVYHGERPWPYGRTLHDAYDLRAAFAPYVPNLRYEVRDLSELPEERIKGAVLLQVAMRLKKHIRDGDQGTQLPGIFDLLHTLHRKQTAIEYLVVLLRYLASATDLERQEVTQAIQGAYRADLHAPSYRPKISDVGHRFLASLCLHNIRLLLGYPVLYGALTRQDAENVLGIGVKEQREWSCFSPSLTKKRRDVLSDGGCLEKIPTADVHQHIELIVGSKTGQNVPLSKHKSACYENNSEP